MKNALMTSVTILLTFSSLVWADGAYSPVKGDYVIFKSVDETQSPSTSIMIKQRIDSFDERTNSYGVSYLVVDPDGREKLDGQEKIPRNRLRIGYFSEIELKFFCQSGHKELERLSIPAGDFTTCQFQSTSGSLPNQWIVTDWYGPNIPFGGIVKQTLYRQDNPAVKITMELYKLGRE